MTTLLIATRNSHKVQEIRQILSEEFAYLTLHDFPGAPVVSEDADTFEGNARKKAVELAKWLSSISPDLLLSKTGNAAVKFYVLADDSGLEVDALQGQPGVHSARFAATDLGVLGNSPDAANNAKLLRLLKQVPLEQRTARFRCVLALTRLVVSTVAKKVLVTEDQTTLVEGACEGKIAFSASGAGGFGYDPLFVPEGYGLSFAELGEEIKNKLSHRACALQRLRESLV